MVITRTTFGSILFEERLYCICRHGSFGVLGIAASSLYMLELCEDPMAGCNCLPTREVHQPLAKPTLPIERLFMLHKQRESRR